MRVLFFLICFFVSCSQGEDQCNLHPGIDLIKGRWEGVESILSYKNSVLQSENEFAFEVIFAEQQRGEYIRSDLSSGNPLISVDFLYDFNDSRNYITLIEEPLLDESQVKIWNVSRWDSDSLLLEYELLFISSGNDKFETKHEYFLSKK